MSGCAGAICHQASTGERLQRRESLESRKNLSALDFARSAEIRSNLASWIGPFTLLDPKGESGCKDRSRPPKVPTLLERSPPSLHDSAGRFLAT